MPRRAESRETERLAVAEAGQSQRSPADRTRAKEWRRGDVAQLVGYRVHKGGWNGQILGIAAVRVASRAPKIRTEILTARPAPLADAACRIDPRHADAIAFPDVAHCRTAFRDRANHLVTGDYGVTRCDQAPLCKVEVGATDAAHANADQYVVRSDGGNRNVRQVERRGSGCALDWPGEEHCTHGTNVSMTRKRNADFDVRVARLLHLRPTAMIHLFANADQRRQAVIRTHRKLRNGASSEEGQVLSSGPSSSNELAADILESLAERLRHGRGSIKRIAAYRKAADAIRRSEISIDDLWNRGDGHALTSIPGVTPAVAQVLTELITSKRIPIGSG